MAHTPGPWTYDGDRYLYEVFVLDNLPGRAVIAQASDQPEVADNVRLISAAPELLAGLKWAEKRLSILVTEDEGVGSFIRGTHTELAGYGKAIKEIRAAIRKAEAS